MKLKELTKEQLMKRHELKPNQEFWRFNLHRTGGRVWLFDIERVVCSKINKLSYSVKWDSKNIYNQPIKKEEVCINNGYFVSFKDGWEAHKGRFDGYIKAVNDNLEGITTKNKNYQYFKNLRIWFEELNDLFNKEPSIEEFNKFKNKHHKFIETCYQEVFT